MARIQTMNCAGDNDAYPDYELCWWQWRVSRLWIVLVTMTSIQATICAVEGGAYPGYNCLVSDDGAYPDYNLCCWQWRVFILKLVMVTVARIQATTCAVDDGVYPGYKFCWLVMMARIRATACDGGSDVYPGCSLCWWRMQANTRRQFLLKERYNSQHNVPAKPAILSSVSCFARIPTYSPSRDQRVFSIFSITYTRN